MTTDPSTDHEDLLARLDLAAKVRLLTGDALFTLPAAPAIGLAGIALSDGPTGVRGVSFAGRTPSCLLPNATLLASTWSEQDLHEVGRLLADEARRQHVHVVLGPTVNLHRTALGGRLFEAYSEDPLLTGRLAAAYVRGLQEQGVGACVKHLVANESETDRMTVDVRLDEATLREVYLLPFEIAVTDADAWSLMAAYNDVNGTACTEQDHVVNEIVKGEWGYPGTVVSDWYATKRTAESANGGLDVVMPGPGGPWGDQLVEAVRTGAVEEAVVDDHLRRLLVLADRVGALGDERDWGEPAPEPGGPERREQLTALAARGMTVLTNDGVLPLDRDRPLVLVGRHAVATATMGGGSSIVTPPHSVDVADGLRAALGDRLTVVDGVEVRTRPLPAQPDLLRDEDGRGGAHLVTRDADGQALTDRHLHGAQTLLGFDDGHATPAAEATLSGTIELTGRAQVGVIGLGAWELRVGGETFTTEIAPAGTDVGEALLNPSGWTTEVELDGRTEIRATVRRDPHVLGRLAIVARPAPVPAAAAIEAAVQAARGADPAVVVVGLTEEQETEAGDKSTLALPGEQDALVTAVAAAATRTVVVVNAATPVLMPWLEQVDAVLWAGLPGQEGGHAVAAALLGDIEPAGRLVTSFPAADGASPAWSVTPTDGHLDYTEGTYVGHRGYFAGLAKAPAFWFGHGLGYGSWQYGAATLGEARPDGAPVVHVEVANTGSRTSREVVQVYFRPAEPDQPVRLVGWAAVTVDPGATATATAPCDARMWRRWDGGGWGRLAPGGELLVARGLGDVRARVELPGS